MNMKQVNQAYEKVVYYQEKLQNFEKEEMKNSLGAILFHAKLALAGVGLWFAATLVYNSEEKIDGVFQGILQAYGSIFLVHQIIRSLVYTAKKAHLFTQLDEAHLKYQSLNINN